MKIKKIYSLVAERNEKVYSEYEHLELKYAGSDLLSDREREYYPGFYPEAKKSWDSHDEELQRKYEEEFGKDHYHPRHDDLGSYYFASLFYLAKHPVKSKKIRIVSDNEEDLSDIFFLRVLNFPNNFQRFRRYLEKKIKRLYLRK